MTPLPPAPFAGLVALDWVVIAVYLVATLAAGVLLARRASGSVENFFLSGRNLPWWLAGTSMVATSFASDTPLVVSGWTRTGGVAGNWRWWSYIVGTLLVVVVFARFWKRSAVVTDVEFMELRYSGTPSRFLRAFKGVYQVVFLHCLVMGWVILGMTKVLTVLLDLPETPLFTVPLPWGPGFGVTGAWLAMFGCAAVALIYSEMSGLWGVVVTDFVQFGVAMAGAIVLAVVVVQHVGGLDALVTSLGAAGDSAKLLSAPPSPASWTEPSLWGREFWEFAIFVAVIWFAQKNSDGSGVMVQRLLACKNERHAIGASLWYGLAHNAVRPWPWILVALASLIALPTIAVPAPVAGTVAAIDAEAVVLEAADGSGAVRVALPAGQPDWKPRPRVAAGDRVAAGSLLATTDDEAAYPVMMRRHLGPGLLGLLVAAFLAAFMSTMDTHVNLASAYLVHDVWHRFVKPEATEAQAIAMARRVGPAILLVALVVAGSATSVRSMFDRFSELFAGIGPIYLLRWFWWRINAWAEITALAVGGTLTLLFEANPAFAGFVAGRLPPGLVEDGSPIFVARVLVIVAASLGTAIPVTLLTPPVDKGHLAAFYERVRPMGAWGPIAKPEGHRAPEAAWWLWMLLAWGGATVLVLGCIFLPGRLLLHGGEGSLRWVAAVGGGLAAFLWALPRLERSRAGAVGAAGDRHQTGQP